MRSLVLACLAAFVAGAVPGPVAAQPPPPRPRAVAGDTRAADAARAAGVVLDPSLARPRPGDSAATIAARRKLGALITEVQVGQQSYDQAAELRAAAQAALAHVRVVYAADKALADQARAELVAIVVQNYISGADVAPQLGVVASTTDPNALLDRMAIAGQIAARQAWSTHAADVSAAAAARAKVAEADAVNAAQDAQRRAEAALIDAQAAQHRAGELVLAAHLTDRRAQAAAMQNAAVTAGDAAAALKAQTLATGAATDADYAPAHNLAAVIAVADGALLRQAAGFAHAPKSVPGFVASTGDPVDETAVMGPKPDLGRTARYVGATGTGPVFALSRFQNDPVPQNGPNAGVGLNVPGTAKPLPANGVTVNPVIPAPKGTVLRASVAVDSALAQLGRPYVWDAAGPSTYDCSGLTQWAWGHAGVGLPHNAAAQALKGLRVAPKELLPGDLVLFGAHLQHVGLYLGAGFMIDAPETGDYVKIQHVSDDADFALAVRP